MNINDIKARLAQLNNKTKKANDIWKAKDEHDIRLLPYAHGSDPFIELHFHYEIGEQGTILCPKLNFDKECAICDFAETLKGWKDSSGEDKPERERKQDWEIFKKIQAKARVFVPVVERGKEAEGAKFWGMSPTTAGEVLSICADADRLEAVGADESNALNVLFGVDKGYDIHVSFCEPGKKGNNKSFPIIKAEGKIKVSKLMPDKKQTDSLLSSVKNIKEVYPELSSDEVEKLFKKFVGGGQAEAKPEGGKEKYAANTKETAKVTGGKSIDDAFGDLVGDGK